MLVDRMDITIAAGKVATIHAALTTLETELDFLMSLDPAAAKRLVRMGLRNETFTRGILDAAGQNPTLIPSSLDLDALERDLTAREQLLPIQQRVQRLHDRLHHTNLLLGADLYAGARVIYKTLKAFGYAAGLGSLLEELGRRFSKKRKPATEGALASQE